MDEHGTKPDQPMYQHLKNCAQFAEYLKFYALPDAINTIVSKELHLHNAVTENTKIIDNNDISVHLQYLSKQSHLKLMSSWKLQKNFNHLNDSHDLATFQTPNLNNYIVTGFNDFLDSDIL